MLVDGHRRFASHWLSENFHEHQRIRWLQNKQRDLLVFEIQHNCVSRVVRQKSFERVGDGHRLFGVEIRMARLQSEMSLQSRGSKNHDLLFQSKER